MNIIKKIYLILPVLLISGCLNPFAPKLDKENQNSSFEIGNLKSIDDLFKNFQYAYSFKDTAIYGKLLAKDFIFMYRDYAIGADVTWDRDEEMKTHYGLFQNAQRLDLVWNNIVSISSDSSNIVRSFMLTITFNPSDIITVDGKVNLTLTKIEDNWKIKQWIDESSH